MVLVCVPLIDGGVAIPEEVDRVLSVLEGASGLLLVVLGVRCDESDRVLTIA